MKFIEVEHMLNYFHVHLRLIASERLSLVHTKISRWKIQIFGNFSPFFHFLSWNPDLFVGGFFFKDDQIKMPKRLFLLQSVYKAPVFGLKYTTATVQKCEKSNIVLHQAPNTTFYSKTKGEIDWMTSFLRKVHTKKIILEEAIILIIRCNFFD